MKMWKALFDNGKTVITVSFDISEPPPKGASYRKGVIATKN